MPAATGSLYALGGIVYKRGGGRALFSGCGAINFTLAAIVAAANVVAWRRRQLRNGPGVGGWREIQ
jgi:hypothetical protein